MRCNKAWQCACSMLQLISWHWKREDHAGPRRKDGPACFPPIYLGKCPIWWFSYCSHWLCDHSILSSECKRSAAIYLPYPVQTRQREDELKAPSSAFQRKPVILLLSFHEMTLQCPGRASCGRCSWLFDCNSMWTGPERRNMLCELKYIERKTTGKGYCLSRGLGENWRTSWFDCNHALFLPQNKWGLQQMRDPYLQLYNHNIFQNKGCLCLSWVWKSWQWGQCFKRTCRLRPSPTPSL